MKENEPGTPGCSCDGLRNAIKQRDEYRAKALEGECYAVCDFGNCPKIWCEPEKEGYCDIVTEKVDGE